MQNYNQPHREASPVLARIRPAQLVIELLIVTLVAIYAGSAYADLDPKQRLGGFEAEYLTHTSYIMSQMLHETGRIPRWNPYLELGDPVFENLYGYAFQPFLIYPSFIYGGALGSRISLVLSVIIVGLGGWVLARVLGLNWLARLVLAWLLIGKGNMHSYLYQGHYGLVVMQAYFPWIFAGTIGILRGFKRWAIMTVGIGFALVFFCGTPYYPPFLAFCMGILTLVYAIDIGRKESGKGFTIRTIHWRRIANVGLSLVITVFLVAVVVIPLLAKKDNLGYSMIYDDHVTDLGIIVNLHFTNPKLDIQVADEFVYSFAFSYYSYIMPYWFAFFLLGTLVAICIVYYLRCRRLPPLPWRIMGASSFLAAFFIVWGAGQNPLMYLGYEYIPIMTQFRHIFRLLALSSLWIGVLGAVSLDVIWKYLIDNLAWLGVRLRSSQRFVSLLKNGAMVGLVVLSTVASYDVVRQWHVSWGEHFFQPENEWEDYCITWFRQQHPGEQLKVWTLNYQNVYTHLRNKVRHGWVASDFYHLGSIPFTVFQTSLIPKFDYVYDQSVFDPALPEYAIGNIHHRVDWLEMHGYKPILESAHPTIDPGIPCLYRREGALSYAFSAPLFDLQQTTLSGAPPAPLTTPITNFVHDYDQIAMVATASVDKDIVVAAQEVSFPGWRVEIDGKPATIESVGGLIGVVLPRDNEQHVIVFQYLPQRFMIGAVTTLIACLLSILYLLRAEQLVLWLVKRGRQ